MSTNYYGFKSPVTSVVVNERNDLTVTFGKQDNVLQARVTDEADLQDFMALVKGHVVAYTYYGGMDQGTVLVRIDNERTKLTDDVIREDGKAMSLLNVKYDTIA